MPKSKQYIFQSERLGFRNWITNDIEKMAAINADVDVMHYFPSTQTLQQTAQFIERMQLSFNENGFCYFAVDKLETSELIGFIGLAEQKFEADFTPCIDIGWRLAKSAWNNGFATEGAKRCLEFAFNDLKLEKIVAMAPQINLPSINVMQKIGMKRVLTFYNHPYLQADERLKPCELYEISKFD